MWTHNGELPVPKRATVKKNHLIIPKLTKNQFGFYECSGTNEEGESFTTISFVWNSGMSYKSYTHVNSNSYVVDTKVVTVTWVQTLQFDI